MCPLPASVANIGIRERRRRMLIGYLALFLGMLAGIVLLVADLEKVWRLTLIFPFWISGLGIFQAQHETWTALAAQGLCNMDQGIEKIKSTADRQQLKKQVQRVYVHTMLLAIILTGLFFLLP